MKILLLKRYLLLLFTCILFSESTSADTFSVSFDTKGFVYGQLSRIIRIGMRNRAINGEIRLGFESSFGILSSGNSIGEAHRDPAVSLKLC